MIQTQPITPTAHSITPQTEAVSALNHILRGELSAVEAYKQVLEKIEAAPERKRLMEFITDHLKAVDFWRAQVEKCNGEPEKDSGSWGFVVEAFVGTAKIFGNESALNALKKGEEHGLSDYKDLLESKALTTDQKNYIKYTAIPNQERHLVSIKAMAEMQ